MSTGRTRRRCLLGHVVAGLSDERLLLWVNTRDRDQRVPSLLDRIARRPAVRHLHLTGLSRSAVREHLVSMTGREVTNDEVVTVHEVTGGNPFFVSEAALALTDPHQDGTQRFVTTGAHNAVAARLSSLDEAVAAGLRCAAVLGHDFEVAVLALAIRTSEVDCLRLLGDGEGAGIVATAGTGRYRFVHALVREAIEKGLDPAQRVGLHRRAAAAVEAVHKNDIEPWVFDLARHWVEAAPGGDRATAAIWLGRAADYARTRCAYEDAMRLYQEGLDVGGVTIDDDLRWRLRIGMARAANQAGTLGDRLDASLAAASAARASGRLDRLAEAALAVDPVGQPGFDMVIRRLCQEVLDQIDDSARSLRARITARLAETYIYLPDADNAATASDQAVRLAEQCGDWQALVAALRARQVVVSTPDRLDERADVAARMIDLAERAASPEVELRGRLCRIDALFERGELTAVASELDRCDPCVEKIGDPLAAYLVLHTRAVLAQARGRVDEALRLADRALAAAKMQDHPDVANRRAAVLSSIGRQAGYHDAWSSEVSGPPDGPTATKPPFIADLSACDALVNAGRIEAAADVWRLLGPTRHWRPPPHVVLIAGALGIEAGATVGTSADLDALHHGLATYRGHHVACGLGAAVYLGPVELWLGRAARHLGRIDEAVSDLEDARRRCDDNGAAGYGVEATFELAAALVARATAADLDRASTLLRPARKTALDLGMALFADRIEALLGRLGLRESDRLTRREWEIAGLLAEGLSNRQIADRLVVSERTAQNHVQHILTKLGLPNRGQVGVWFERSRRENK